VGGGANGGLVGRPRIDAQGALRGSQLIFGIPALDRGFVVEAAKRHGFDSVAAYLRDLVRREREREQGAASTA
jgi:hypothetical protein